MIDAHAVTDIASLQKVLSLRRNSRVVVTLPYFASEESGKLQDQVNRLLSECGCNISACALIVSVVACGFIDATYWSTVNAHIFKTLGIDLLACFAAAGLGRAAGLLRAKWELARMIKAIEDRLQ